MHEEPPPPPPSHTHCWTEVQQWWSEWTFTHPAHDWSDNPTARFLLCNLQESPPRWRTPIIRAAARHQLGLLIKGEEDLNPFTVGGTICQSTDWRLKPFRPTPTACKGERCHVKLSAGGLEQFFFKSFLCCSGK